jgi:superfamily II DNA or RNA helicase
MQKMQFIERQQLNIKLRPWQVEAHKKAIDWLSNKKQDRHFLINAAPGAGKTLAACAIAKTLLDSEEISRVIVIAPRTQVVSQWADDFTRVTGRHMGKVTARDGEIEKLDMDICATWSAVQGLFPELQAVCRSSRVLVICDEHHHAAVEAAWGASADGAFENAKYVLVLTGTPIRSDGSESVWLAYDDKGAISHPEEGTYTLTYGQSVDLGYCRPITFHKHQGRFTVDLGGEKINVSGDMETDLPKNLSRIPGLQTALDFYKLAKTPQYMPGTEEPLMTGYQASMLESGIEKLNQLRLVMPEAGGLVIAPTIEVAEFMADILEKLDGERPLIVHSQLANPEDKIKQYRNTNRRWLVSVAMVSEGVDIKRLRVLVYLPNALTELAFRQAMGRVVRTASYEDISRAYVVMPAFKTFEKYAKRVEEEMSVAYRKDPGPPKEKVCPKCGEYHPLSAKECDCGYEFPVGPVNQKIKKCVSCGSLNPISSTHCHACGNQFSSEFELTLDEALRVGAIVRGMELDENEVRASEEVSKELKKLILRSGDQHLVQILRTIPEESYSRLEKMFDQARFQRVY